MLFFWIAERRNKRHIELLRQISDDNAQDARDYRKDASDLFMIVYRCTEDGIITDNVVEKFVYNKMCEYHKKYYPGAANESFMRSKPVKYIRPPTARP
jgi:hypothetical protein